MAYMSLSEEELKTREALRRKVLAIAEDHGNMQCCRIIFTKSYVLFMLDHLKKNYNQFFCFRRFEGVTRYLSRNI